MLRLFLKRDRATSLKILEGTVLKHTELVPNDEIRKAHVKL
jgi:hypothetical protein